MKCESCEHKEVCSKKEAYKEAFDNINKDVGEFEVELKCKWYKGTISNYAQQLQQLSQKTATKPWPDYPKPYIGDLIPDPNEITCKYY